VVKIKELKVALIGDLNTGKTSLLNSLTGTGLHVGNWTGKTVMKKEGVLKPDYLNTLMEDGGGRWGFVGGVN